jgi:nucleoid-associated protein YgaU
MPRTYTVQPGDTLSGIAQHQLGDASRWPEIFLLNRSIIRHPDRISPGQVLTLPGDTPMQPPPRIYVVRRGDTLSAIAQRELGNASRWPEIFERNRDVISDPTGSSPTRSSSCRPETTPWGSRPGVARGRSHHGTLSHYHPEQG